MNYIFDYPLYVFFGILPSFLWLQFYLKKDVRPEPKLMVLKIFFYGMLTTIPAVFLETVFLREIGNLNYSLHFLFVSFLLVAFVEEVLKFLVVKFSVLNDPEFNEPVDAMIYMIVAALGFAAGENILILLPLKSFFLSQIIGVSLLRFLWATFLHALSAAVIGFFLGLSFFEKEQHPDCSHGHYPDYYPEIKRMADNGHKNRVH